MSHVIEGLSLLGKCRVCSQFVRVDSTYWSLPVHMNLKGKRCPNSGYSSDEVKYHVESHDQAVLLAQAMLQDTSTCLGGGTNHTMACADGRDCQEERDRRAKALAQVFLRK